MKYFSLTFFLLLLLPGTGAGGIRPSVVDVEKPLVDSNIMMERALQQINRWGFTIRFFPGLDDGSMTYCFDVELAMKSQYLRTIEEAQAFYVEVYKLALRQMNQVREIRPYLASFPLTPGAFELSLFFNDGEGRRVSGEYIAAAILSNNKLRFVRYDGAQGPSPEWCTSEITGLKELYAPVCPRSPVHPKRVLPGRPFDTWRYNSTQTQEVISFLRERCRETELSLIVVGGVGKTPFDSRGLNFSLSGTQRLTLADAKLFASKWVQYTTDYSQSSQLYKEHLRLRHEQMPRECPSPDPTPQQIAFRISFWDENLDRPVAPFIAEIRLLDEKLSYFTADDNQCLVLKFEESFADALVRQQTELEKPS